MAPFSLYAWIEVQRIFPETKTDPPRRIPITIRRLYLHDPNVIGEEGTYRIVCTRRKGERRLSLSLFPRKPISKWTDPRGYVVEEEWKIITTLTTEGLIDWLIRRVDSSDIDTLLDLFLFTRAVKGGFEWEGWLKPYKY